MADLVHWFLLSAAIVGGLVTMAGAAGIVALLLQLPPKQQAAAAQQGSSPLSGSEVLPGAPGSVLVDADRAVEATWPGSLYHPQAPDGLSNGRANSALPQPKKCRLCELLRRAAGRKRAF